MSIFREFMDGFEDGAANTPGKHEPSASLTRLATLSSGTQPGERSGYVDQLAAYAYGLRAWLIVADQVKAERDARKSQWRWFTLTFISVIVAVRLLAWVT